MAGHEPKPPPLSGRAGEHIRTACLVLITVCLVGAALAHLGTILTPLLIALMLFFMIRPAADAVARLRVPAWLTVAALGLALIVAVQVTGEVVLSNARAFQARLPHYREQLLAWVDAAARLTGHANDEGRFDWQEHSLQDLLQIDWTEVLRVGFGTTLGLIETTLLVLFYLLFIFLESQRLPRRVRRAFSPEYADKILTIGARIDEGMRRYLMVKTAVSLGLAAVTGLLCYLFGLDFWPLWAVLMFLGNYITYIGSAVACVPPIALAYLQFRGLVAPTALAVLLVANRFFWIDYVEIRFSGKQLEVSPLVLLLSLAVFGWLWGVVGMVLAVPLVTAVKIVLINIERTKPYGILLSEE
jgi:predicted PurR-regulated permease PerM